MSNTRLSKITYCTSLYGPLRPFAVGNSGYPPPFPGAYRGSRDRFRVSLSAPGQGRVTLRAGRTPTSSLRYVCV